MPSKELIRHCANLGAELQKLLARKAEIVEKQRSGLKSLLFKSHLERVSASFVFPCKYKKTYLRVNITRYQASTLELRKYL